MIKNTERFSDRVENYVRCRPSYPQALITLLETDCQLSKASSVVDVGSGTGLLTTLLLDAGAAVTAVEPNDEMRWAAEEMLSSYDRFVSVGAPAEATGLPDSCADMVTVAQAFHWFDHMAVRCEFGRLLKSQGWVVLVWNTRNRETAFQQAYHALLTEHAPEYGKVHHHNISDESLADWFGPAEMRRTDFEYAQSFEWDGFLGRVLSSSYTPNPQSALYKPMVSALETLFAEYETDGIINFEYTTNVYYGQLK